ncbi:hypothetical protein [Streptomyces sp. NPDC088752]|uniref:hypothetical protein n=1 Tax=Streptomyces sp. NPDC088752 TaxID=3154963 RepID=UPI0034201EA1
MSPPRIAIAGTGAFAGTLLRALARHREPLDLSVLGSDAGRAGELAELARNHAALSGAPPTCRGHGVDPGDPDGPERLLASLRPDVLVVCTSEHSPAESRTAPSAWTDLVSRAGFALTLPLQTGHVLRYARAAERAAPDTLLVNACFPDAVNPLLTALGAPVVCGVGNVATLAAALAGRAGVADPRRLHLLAHHAHLHPPEAPGLDARAWLDGSPADLTGELTAVRRRARSHLNEVGALAAAAPLAALAGAGPDHTGHLPGPAGLPGGYPVTVTHRHVALRLPPGLSRDEAVRWNTEAGRLDGAVAGAGGAVRLTPAALSALRPHWPDVPEEWTPARLTPLREAVLRLRTRLRALPPSPPPPSDPRTTPSLRGAAP